MRRFIVLVSALFLSPLMVGHAWGQVQYSVTDLGTLPGYTNRSYANGINSSGQVVGLVENASNAYRAFLYSGGTMQDLGTLGGAGPGLGDQR